MNILHRLRHRNPDGTCRHSFEPRYEEQPSGIQLRGVIHLTQTTAHSLLIRRVYVRDVCRHCGATVERKP